jgi:hypothetical protein
MTTPRRGASPGAGSARHVKRGDETDGYDANDDEADTGLEPMSLASDEDGEVSTESGLSLDTEDLGPRMLESAMQGSRAPTGEGEASSQVPSEPGGLDLTKNVIDEGSLFDQPRAEGGTRRPEIRTDEVDATLDRNQRAGRERLKRGPKKS